MYINTKRELHNSFCLRPSQPLLLTTIEPEPNGKPGSIRVDMVHQREVYYINAVCEVVQPVGGGGVCTDDQ